MTERSFKVPTQVQLCCTVDLEVIANSKKGAFKAVKKMDAFDIATEYARRNDWLLVILDEKIKVTKKVLDKWEPKIEIHIYNILNELIDAGFDLTYDFECGVGTASTSFVECHFSIGQENFYFSFSAHTKEAGIETVKALNELATFIERYR